MIDLFSDTRTKPTPDMRRAIAEAEVDDEQAGLDPTVNALCERVADLLGKPAALFLPSGTMCNAIAYRTHCRPGDEIILHRTAHGITAEAGGPAALAGAMICPLDGERGLFTADQVRAALRSGSRYEPRSRLVVVEQTSNFGGGTVWPVEQLRDIVDLVAEHGMAAHMDGARLMNAVVASGVGAARQAAGFDSVWLDFSKGLGAPVGAVLAGSEAFIAEAWKLKQQMGGAMRQAGIIAAACLYALDHHVERLAEDHANARRLADGLAELPGVLLEPASVDTNIVFFDLAPSAPTADEVEGRLEAKGVRIGALGPRRMRAVTHLGVGRDDIDSALQVLAAVLT
ncbi:MAG TPA: threonine aldolase family protein [Euzebyales bacterium]|nr:threonine aldolase family protein [Euzebyales bacterium]